MTSMGQPHGASAADWQWGRLRLLGVEDLPAQDTAEGTAPRVPEPGAEQESVGGSDSGRQGGTRRVNANFSDEAYDALAQLARQRGKSISDVLRDAIAFEQWYQRTLKEGGRVLVERNGRFRELVRV